ncbi:carbohydrate kinase family protein [Desulfofustis glycolicus]|uniref:Fructokinase n=1 Tax=Desulfofustis glycolicus DSM 9705 TaxID=1121409 RepID=A0A1M5VGJ5_9BACT|nr:carbohydrate kinase [Desulfofustis glycolicus]SHH74350.1 fructokinase [Desulfofustis glycolicus DSM 9705]
MFTVAGIGELLWDVLPSEEKLGGAPINFTYHAAALGGESIPISSIGNDSRGERALDFLAAKQLDTRCISISDQLPTGFVTIELDNAGVAHYHFPDHVAWDHLLINQAAQSVTDRLDAVCFGTLAQRNRASRTTIRHYLTGLPAATKRVFDLNLRQDFYSRDLIETSLELCSILKLNEDELATLASMFGLSGNTQEQMNSLLRGHCLELVILTRGAGGSILLSDEECVSHPGTATTVVDTIGAGDSFTAAVVIGLLLQRPLAEINETASRLAAYVCSQSGAMPDIPQIYGYHSNDVKR